MTNNTFYIALAIVVSLIICTLGYYEHSERLECYKYNPNNGQVCKG